MKLEQLYTQCLAHAAYYLESNGEAAIFDPLRETASYLEMSENNEARIKYIFETHFHADFVSGHLDLAAKTDAKIVFGPTAEPQFEATIAADGQEFTVGNCIVRAIHTPGHTLESTVYIITDESKKDCYLISGDTLFIGDVGRPDLAQHINPELSEEKLATMLYYSIRNKILPLSDELIVYPNHGAGSACGKNMSKETFDTLGNQKKVNYALNANLSEAEFVQKVLQGLTTPPAYFPSNVKLNIQGYESFEKILKKNLKPLSISTFELIAEDETILILDTRNANVFSQGFIPASINIGIDGNFAQWVGEIVQNVEQRIVLVTEPGRETETITRLARIGFDNVLGYLEGGFETWKNKGNLIDQIIRIDSEMFEVSYKGKPTVFDVRKKSEFESKHIIGAENIPLNQLLENLDKFPNHIPFILICAGGYRSMIAASILKKKGWRELADIEGGMSEIEKGNIPIAKLKIQTTQL